MTIVPKCIYCKHNEGENKQSGFMWHCKPLGYCVPFEWKKKQISSETIYCKAQHLGKGSFLVDEVKYREYKAKKK